MKRKNRNKTLAAQKKNKELFERRIFCLIDKLDETYNLAENKNSYNPTWPLEKKKTVVRNLQKIITTQYANLKYYHGINFKFKSSEDLKREIINHPDFINLLEDYQIVRKDNHGEYTHGNIHIDKKGSKQLESLIISALDSSYEYADDNSIYDPNWPLCKKQEIAKKVWKIVRERFKSMGARCILNWR